jgi:hypothetical protein
VGDVEDPLVVRVAVDRVHQAALDAEQVGRPSRPAPQFVVQLALLMMSCVRVVAALVHAEDDRDVPLPLAGALMITFFAPAFRVPCRRR